MEIDIGGGCMKLVVGVLLVVAIICGGYIILQGGQEKVADAQASRDQAAARLVQAQTDKLAQQQVGWESRFIYWTTAMAAFNMGPSLLDGFLLLMVLSLAGAVYYLHKAAKVNHE